MTKESVIKRKTSFKKLFKANPVTGSKFVILRAETSDTSDWIYIYDDEGGYVATVNRILRESELVTITEEEFLTNAG